MYGCWLVLPSVLQHSCPYFILSHFLLYLLCCKAEIIIIIITRITSVNNICFCYVVISDDISTHADFQVDGYHGC